jgi:phosphodiesterase/alkaline phosphatase D-like protein
VVRWALVSACFAAAALGAQSALAASAPAVTTGTATGVGTTSATLNGTVNAEGQPTSYQFEYGTTTAYGSATTPGDAGDGTTAVAVSTQLGSLTPNTIYHYRLLATNGSGTITGGDETFTTTAQPPGASTGAATAVSASSATLTGSVNPEGQPTTYHFDYGTTTAYGSSTAAGTAGNGTAAVSASAAIGSLQPNTTYHYRLVATNGSRTTTGAEETFTTARRPAAATTGPTKSVSATSATLTGSVNPEGQPTTYPFQYGTTIVYGSATAVTNAGGGTATVSASAAIGSLQPNTTYHYRLVATNGSGSSFGADRHITTGARPPSVSTDSASSVTLSTATLTASIDPRGQSTSYYFQYGTSKDYGTQTATASVGAGGNSVRVAAALAGLTPRTAYHYRIVATNGSGTAAGADKTFTTSAPPRIGLVASPSALLFGQATSLTGALAGSRTSRLTVTLQRASSPGGPFVTVATTTSTGAGRFAFPRQRPSALTYYRASAGGATSAQVRVAVAFRIALFLSRNHPRRGHRVRFHGTVSPARGGLHVLLQRLGPDHRWHTIRMPRLHRRRGRPSLYTVFITVRRNGLWRAVLGPNAGNARGVSPVRRIRVRPARRA